MAESSLQVPAGLNSRVFQLMPRVDYRIANTPEQKEEVFRLRHDAYVREGAITKRSDRLFYDEVDDTRNTFIFGVYIDENLVSSIRLSVTMPGSDEIPTAHVFPEMIGPDIQRGLTIVDPTRFVADHESSRRFPELPYITLRIPWLAMEYFNADLMLAAVRPEHEAFYRRLWGNRTVCSARSYPGLLKPVSLTVLDYRAARDGVRRRYPFFASTKAERESLFDSPQPVEPGPRRTCWSLQRGGMQARGGAPDRLLACEN
jgi:hypothetical protein